MYFIYILKSKKDGKKYIGQTNNPEKRLHLHNSKQVHSTKGRVPLEIIYTESYNTRAEAVSREKYLKSHKGYNFLKKIGLY